MSLSGFYFQVALRTAPLLHPPGSVELTSEERARLEGHDVRPYGGGFWIASIAGGPPARVGCVEPRADGLYFLEEGSSRSYRIVGPLSAARLAGPYYRVWLVGEVESGEVRPTRLGILSPPRKRSCSP